MSDKHPQATEPPPESRPVSLEGRRGWRRLLDPHGWPGAVLLYSLVGAVVGFWRLGATGLVSMEGMTFDTAGRMLASGDWVVPYLYGEIYSYKPALAYWLGSIPLVLSEAPSEALLRAPFAACGFVMGLAVLVLIGRQAGWRGGLLAASASITGLLFLQKARMAEFDIVVTAGVGVAVAVACVNLSASRQRWGVWLLGYGALAAGILAKGVPALVAFGPGIVVAALASGRLRRLFGWRHLSAVLLFAAIIGGYLWAAWETAGPAAFEQPLGESRVRGFSWLGRKEAAMASAETRWISDPDDRWGEGWVRMVVLAVVKPVSIWSAYLPWTLLLLYPLLRYPVLRRAGPEGRLPPLLSGRLERCAAGFLVAGTLMFLLVPSHEMRYYLPLCAPVGILCGLLADRLLGLERDRIRGLLAASFGLAALFAVATVVLALRFNTPPIAMADRWLLAVAGTLAGAAGFYSWRWRGGGPAGIRHGLLGLLGIAALCALLCQYLGTEPYRASKRDLRPQAEELARHLPAGEPVWVPGPAGKAGKHASLFYYLDRPIRAFRPERGLPPPGARCLVTAQDLEELETAPGFQFREIARAEHVWFSYRLGTCSEAG